MRCCRRCLRSGRRRPSWPRRRTCPPTGRHGFTRTCIRTANGWRRGPRRWWPILMRAIPWSNRASRHRRKRLRNGCDPATGPCRMPSLAVAARMTWRRWPHPRPAALRGDMWRVPVPMRKRCPKVHLPTRWHGLALTRLPWPMLSGPTPLLRCGGLPGSRALARGWSPAMGQGR